MNMDAENKIRNKKKRRPRRKRKSWLPFLLFITLCIASAILFVHIQAKSELIKKRTQAELKDERPAVNVVALELVPSMIRDRINLPGTVKPWLELRILTEVGGKVVQKKISEGAMLKKGGILAKIDTRDYENAYLSAKANYELAAGNLARVRKLYKQGVAPQSQLDDATAAIRNTRAARDNAALMLERCTIKAPLAGTANRVFIEPGQFLKVGDPIAEIIQMDRVKVRVGIPESDVDAVRSIDDFDVTIDALGGRTFRAKKYFLSKTADPMARLYNLDLEIQNADGIILPDMFARIEIVKKEVPQGLSIPLYSVITRNKEQFVYTVNDSQVHKKKVTLGLLEGWRVEVTEGLQAGEKVIVVGHRSVNEGDMVNIVATTTNQEDILK